MTSKERVNLALDHKEPDRVPVGEWGIDHHITKQVLGHKTYWRNRKEETLTLWEGRRDEVVESWKKDLVAVVNKLEHDLIPVSFCPPKNLEPSRIKKIAEDTWEDEVGNIYKYTPANDAILCVQPKVKENKSLESEEEVINYFEKEYIPASGFSIVDKMGENYIFKLSDESQLEFARYVIEELRKEKFIFARGFTEFEVPGVATAEDFFIYIALKPELVKKLFDLVIQLQIYQAGLFIELGVDAIMPGGDFSDSRGPMVSPHSIREIFLPGMKRFSDFVHSQGCRIMSHNCGNNWRIMDILIESGYEAYQSIQAKTGSMDIKLLKERYGDKIALWGGINIETLTDGTIEDVNEEVEYALRYGAPSGGFILGTSNSVAYGTKYDNYIAALEVCHKFGNYPLRIPVRSSDWRRTK